MKERKRAIDAHESVKSNSRLFHFEELRNSRMKDVEMCQFLFCFFSFFIFFIYMNETFKCASKCRINNNYIFREDYFKKLDRSNIACLPPLTFTLTQIIYDLRQSFQISIRGHYGQHIFDVACMYSHSRLFLLFVHVLLSFFHSICVLCHES